MPNVPADIAVGLANAFDRRNDKAPQKNLLDYLSPQKVDHGNQRTEAQRQALGTRRALSSGITDSATGRATTLATLAEQINAVNKVNEGETNINSQILQDVLAKNNQIQGLNNETRFSNEVLSQQFKDDKRAKNLQLASRIANESSQRTRDKNASELAEKQNLLAVLAQDDPRVIRAALESGMFEGNFSEEKKKKILEFLSNFEKSNSN